MKKISIILLFLTAVCPLAQAQRVKVYVTDAWDKPLGEVAVTLGRGRTPVAVTGADGMAEVDAGEGDRMTLTLLNRMSCSTWAMTSASAKAPRRHRSPALRHVRSKRAAVPT